MVEQGPTPALRRIDRRSLSSASDEMRAFMAVHNERGRLPAVLDHHRSLGVHRFFVIDNRSTDGTADYLLAEPDVHVFQTKASYQDARNGIDWIELLLRACGDGRWCLMLDADEQLVYPDYESLGLGDLCRDLAGRGLNCLATLFVDLYSDRPIADTTPEAGRSMLQTCPYFDGSGYYSFPTTGSPLPRVYGGPRARLFWPEIDLESYAGRLRSYVDRAFDDAAYLMRNPDVSAEVTAGRLQSGLEHFLSYGHLEARDVPLRGLADWPEEAYLEKHPDVRDGVAKGTLASGLDHYVRFGQFEGRLFWASGPPRLSQVPLVLWQHHMRLEVGRHDAAGVKWPRADAVGGALFHFKLTADLAGRAAAVVNEAGNPASSAWNLENERYAESLRHNRRLSAMGTQSIRFRDVQQLIDLGLVTPLSRL